MPHRIRILLVATLPVIGSACGSPTDARPPVFADLQGSWQIAYTTTTTQNPPQVYDSRNVASCGSPATSPCVPRPFYLVLDTINGQQAFAFSPAPRDSTGFTTVLGGTAAVVGDSLFLVVNGSLTNFGTYHYHVLLTANTLTLTTTYSLDSATAASIGLAVPSGLGAIPATQVEYLTRAH